MADLVTKIGDFFLMKNKLALANSEIDLLFG